MPEYLAPGVYVEETSFRAKSIEGVGTSTTAFVGPTRKGPLAEARAPLELLTSFGDFERLYGGLENLDFGPGDPPDSVPNYIAHAVLNYFNEGGARLYVARVANGANPSATPNLREGLGGGAIVIRSRFGGRNQDGVVFVRENSREIAASQRDKQHDGTLLRVSDPRAKPAEMEGGPLPANLTPPAAEEVRLTLQINGNGHTIVFGGRAAVLSAGTDLADPVPDPAARELRIRINGVAHLLQLPDGAARGDYVTALDALLPGVTADLDGDRLRLTTTLRGTRASIEILNDQPELGFAAGDGAVAQEDPVANNVGDLSAVTFADLQARVAALNAGLGAGAPILDVVELEGGGFSLQTFQANEQATLQVRNVGGGGHSAHAALGLPAPNVAAVGGEGAPPLFFQRATVGGNRIWHVPGDPNTTLNPADLANRSLHLLSFDLEHHDADPGSDPSRFENLAFGRDHPRYAGGMLRQDPVARADVLTQAIWLEIAADIDPLELYTALLPPGRATETEEGLTASYTLTGGSDGVRPMVGAPTDVGSYAAALELLRSLEDVSIVAAPGHSAHPNVDTGASIRDALISHVSKPRAYRIAVLDSRPELLPGGVLADRGQIDSDRAALYYPWVTVSNPLFRPGRENVPSELDLPPSGFLCGIYARNDAENSVAKAPANEVVRGALRFESDINFAQNQLLNPQGVNCLRFFPGRGYRVWGARLVSSDPEWKYVNVRRYFNYLEASIDRGTQWAVFENNGERLWANIRETVESFLYNEWISGNLLGTTTEQAYFVRCDRSTMTQNDLDNGRLICLIGIAVLKPAEFVIFRIGQKTADAGG